MILNLSGRTDICAFYSEWLMNRLAEGYIDVRNPFYQKMVSRIMTDDVDLLFFTTKNPIPMLDKLKGIKKKVYFHVTLTAYKEDIEPGLPPKKDIIDAVRKLSEAIGKENIVIRYDPVFINDKYTLEYHVKAFDRLCELLDGYVSKILISFIDEYKNVRKNYAILNYRKLTDNDYEVIGTQFSQSAAKHNILVHTCAEERNLTEYGFIQDECMSRELAFKLTGKTFKKWNARKNVPCQCVEMADVGVYNSCRHFCRYCYANFDEKAVKENCEKHDPKSSLLIGELNEDDIIKIRK